MKSWKYYNHAAIPATAPHDDPDLTYVLNGEIWKAFGKQTPLLARWTTDFDCGYETNWWYIVKDEPFDISALKSNYRYKINKGVKYFEVKLIDPKEFKEELYRVQVAAFSAYPKKYRPKIDKEKFIKSIDDWNNYTVFGAFFRETGDMVGYSIITNINEDWLDFTVQKTNPEYERWQLNAALVEKIMMHYADFLGNGGIICDGSRNINHETAFQDYLEKYFGFRKAYCKLHITYNPRLKWVIRLIYPVRRLLLKIDGIGFIHAINSVLKMEEICRNEECI